MNSLTGSNQLWALGCRDSCLTHDWLTACKNYFQLQKGNPLLHFKRRRSCLYCQRASVILSAGMTSKSFFLILSKASPAAVCTSSYLSRRTKKLTLKYWYDQVSKRAADKLPMNWKWLYPWYDGTIRKSWHTVSLFKKNDQAFFPLVRRYLFQKKSPTQNDSTRNRWRTLPREPQPKF